MNSTQFQRLHEVQWRTLEGFLQTRRYAFRSKDEFNSFTSLYRQTASDLAYAQTFFPKDAVTRYLNVLVGQAHNQLYGVGGRGRLSNGVAFLLGGFPRLFRSLGGYIALATLISMAAAIYGYATTLATPLAAYQLLPASIMSNINPAQTGPHIVNAPLMSSTIMTHNMLVAFIAFAGGASAGLFTIYAMWQNGLILGVLAALFQMGRKSALFWSLIVPHGVTELTAIFIAGGAGLLFAHRMLAPGRLARSAAVRRALTQSVQLMLGTVPMFMIAGTIEGFLTPSSLPMWVKFLVAAVTGLGWLLYFSVLGRKMAPTILSHSGALRNEKPIGKAKLL